MYFLAQEGNGELIVGGERMMIREGECFILLPEVPHSYHGLEPKWIVSSIGLTIVQYAQRLKIGRARMLLERYPQKDTAEIGRECGYESPSYFGLQFKRITGTTPNQYRKSATAIRAQ